MKLTDAQFGVLHTLRSFGPKEAIEVLGPLGMDGKRKTKLEWNVASGPTLAALEAAGLVAVQRMPTTAPKNAVGKRGKTRRVLRIAITDKGREALSSI